MKDIRYVDLYLTGRYKPEHLAPAHEHLAFCGTPIPPECYQPIDYLSILGSGLCPGCREWYRTYKTLQELTQQTLPHLIVRRYCYPTDLTKPLTPLRS